MSEATMNVMHSITKKETRPMLAIWGVLFVLTILFSDDLSWRGLAAAFCAWLGGIVTAEIIRAYSIIEMITKNMKRNNEHQRHH
jgi:hypothetical protein